MTPTIASNTVTSLECALREAARLLPPDYTVKVCINRDHSPYVVLFGPLGRIEAFDIAELELESLTLGASIMRAVTFAARDAVENPLRPRGEDDDADKSEPTEESPIQ